MKKNYQLPERKQIIRDAQARGLSVSQVAEELKVKPSRIHLWCYQFRVKLPRSGHEIRKRNPYTTTTTKAIALLFHEPGRGNSDIARELHVTREFVRQIRQFMDENKIQKR